MKRFLISFNCILLALLLIGLVPLQAAAEVTDFTSSDYRFEKEYYDTLRNYPKFEELTYGTFALPGLEHTVSADGVCDLMVPQGICTAGDYILITAYCGVKKQLEGLQNHLDNEENRAMYAAAQAHTKHNSVIYVLNRSNYSLVSTVMLPNRSHVGGIAFDGTYLWITDSDSNNIDNNYMNPILFSDFRSRVTASYDRHCTVEYSAPAKSCPCYCRASYATYSENLLWVGEFDEDNPARLVGFSVNRDDINNPSLTEVCSLPIPAGANGAAFSGFHYEKGGRWYTELAVNTSYGRNKDSLSTIYTVDVTEMNSFVLTGQKRQYVMPPMLENTCVDAGTVYTLFESAATPYSTINGNKCGNIVDRVCVGRSDEWFTFVHHQNRIDRENITEYEPTDEENGKYVPNTVMVGSDVYGGFGRSKLLFNPRTALMLRDMSEQAYKLGKEGFSWENKLKNDYGYEQFAYSKNNGTYLVGSTEAQETIDDGNGGYEVINVQKEKFMSACNAIVSLKKVVYNGQTKYAVAVAFRGTEKTDLADWLADVNCFKGMNEIHNGFEQNARDFFEECKTIAFDIDGLTITLYDMIEEMSSPMGSKYCMLVTGHSLGAAIADIFVGEILYNRGVRENVAAYTFGAPCSVSSYYDGDGRGNNIFNIINADDPVTKIGASSHIGLDIVFEPDDAFRAENYGSNYAAGYGSDWWSEIIASTVDYIGGAIFKFKIRCIEPHSIANTYRSVTNKLSLTGSNGQAFIDRYTPYHTNGNINWDNESVTLDYRSFTNFEGDVLSNASLSLLGIRENGSDNYICPRFRVGGNFDVSRLYSFYEGNYILVEGDVTFRGDSYFDYGTIEVKGNYHQVGSLRRELIYTLTETILSGNSAQTISFDTPDEYNTFKILTLQNENVRFLTPVYNLSLGKDTVINDNLNVLQQLDMNGYSLTVNGNLGVKSLWNSGPSHNLTVNGNINAESINIGAGTFNLSGNLNTHDIYFTGTADIKGDFVAQNNCNLDFCRINIGGSFRPAHLVLNNTFTTVTVNGDLILSGSNGINCGTIKLKGNLKQISQNTDCISANTAVKLIFCGDKRQTISFENPCIDNSLPWGTVFENSNIDFLTPVYQLNIHYDTSLNCTRHVSVSDAINVIEGVTFSVNADVIAGNVYNSGTVNISGSLNAENIRADGGLNVIGDLKVSEALYAVKSTVKVDGNADIKKIYFNSTNSFALSVNGNLDISEAQYDNYTQDTDDKIIEVKGNLHTGKNCFLAPGITVIFNGGITQRVSTSGDFILLSAVILDNESENGVVFENPVTVERLFNHKGNKFTLSNLDNSRFNDYDRDGMTDQEDPYPMVSVGFILGDVNLDGRVNIDDITVLQRSMVMLGRLNALQVRAADVNGDYITDINDVTIIQRYIAEFEVEYNVGADFG